MQNQKVINKSLSTFRKVRSVEDYKLRVEKPKYQQKFFKKPLITSNLLQGDDTRSSSDDLSKTAE